MNAKSVDLVLLSILNDLVTSLPDGQSEYMILANYYEIRNADQAGERWPIAQIWVSQEATNNVQVTDEGLICDVHLDRSDHSNCSTILLPFDQIWSIQRLTRSIDHHQQLYLRGDKMKLPDIE